MLVLDVGYGYAATRATTYGGRGLNSVGTNDTRGHEDLFTGLVSTLAVLLHDGSGGDLRHTIAVAPRLFSALIDMLVLALLFSYPRP